MGSRPRRWLRRIGTAALIAAVTIGALEAGLAFTDPLGARYFNEQNTLFFRETAQVDPRGYGVQPGTYHASRWSFTILPDGTRAVPATNSTASRTAVFIGDSLTFSYGVDDADTWINLLAAEFPEWRFVNAALPAFSAVNYARALALYADADAIFVVTIPNDSSEPPAVAPFDPMPPITPYTLLYLRLLSRQITVKERTAEERAEIAAKWEASLRALAADPRVTVITFDNGPYTDEVRAVVPDAAAVGYFTERISAVDPHANAAGNRQLYASMLPVVREALRSD